MENDRNPGFVGEGLIRSGQTTMMAHPLSYEDIMAREDVKSLPSGGVQDSAVIGIYKAASSAREEVAKQIRQQSLKGSF